MKLKIKLTIGAVLLMMAIAVQLSATNFIAFAERSLPTSDAATMITLGDPIPGVDVSIEQSPSGKIIATTQTDDKGIATFLNIVPGKYLVRTKLVAKPPNSPGTTRASNNYNSSKSNTAGVIKNAKVTKGSLGFLPGKEGNATITVAKIKGSQGQTITIQITEAAQPTSPHGIGKQNN